MGFPMKNLKECYSCHLKSQELRKKKTREQNNLSRQQAGPRRAASSSPRAANSSPNGITRKGTIITSKAKQPQKKPVNQANQLQPAQQQPRARRAVPATTLSYWICGGCRGFNSRNRTECYSCGTKKQVLVNPQQPAQHRSSSRGQRAGPRAANNSRAK